MYTLNDASIIESFQGLIDDLDTLTYAAYFCELIDIAFQQEESNRDFFKEFVSCLYLIKSKAIENDILARAFELRVLNSTGFGMDLNKCCICGRKISTSNYFNFQYSGGVCSTCERKKGMGISFSTFNILKFLLRASFDKMGILSVNSVDKNQLYIVNSTIISQAYGRMPKSLEILKLLKE